MAIGCTLHPVHNRLLEVGMLVGAVLVWGALLLLARGYPKRRILWALPVLGLLPFALPGKAIDSNALRSDYVKRLRGYDGTRYVWGGESPLGIDCSGLPRRALRDALWAEGWQKANGTAFREWLSQWWFDSSARAMGQGYRGETRTLGLAGPLWKLDQPPLRPGDLAVRADGIHVVVYLGGNQWIEADPGRSRVRCWDTSPRDGPWYEPMVAHRWVICECPG